MMNNSKSKTRIKALKKFLASVDELPVRGKKALIKSISEQIKKSTGVSVSTQTLYKNSICRDLINAKCEKQGVEGIVKRSVLKEGEDCEATRSLKKYLGNMSEIPSRNGKVNVTQIAKEAGVKKSEIYQKNCRQLLNEACEKNGVIGIENREDQAKKKADNEKMQLERENNKLKRKNAALYAEIFDLRKKSKKYEKKEEMMKKGQQTIP